MSAQFSGLLQALSLHRADSSFVSRMAGTITFQGNQINISELGPELTQALPRLMNNDEEEGGRNGRGGSQEVTLFDSIKLAPVPDPIYLTRRVEHNAVLLTNGCSSRRALQKELTARMENLQRLDVASARDSFNTAEIFAVSWAASTNGTGECSRRKRKADDSEDENGDVHNGVIKEEDNDCDPVQLTKVSEFLNWKEEHDKQGQAGYSVNGSSNHVTSRHKKNDKQRTEEDNNNNNCKKISDEDMTIFMDTCSRQKGGLSTLRLIELDEVENPDVKFAQLCSATSLFTVHWLQAFPEGFIWKKTRGPSKFSRLKLGPISYQEEDWLKFLEHKAWQTVICISAVAGMGKTTFLTSMAHRLKLRYKSRLVCLISLERLASFIDGMHYQSLDILKFADLLVKYFNIVSEVEQSILKCLLYSLDGSRMEPKMELLMDGLETMSARSRQILIEFFKTEFSSPLYSSIRVWLTTRPHMKHEVEDTFSIVAYGLDGLNSTDLESYFKIHKYGLHATDLFSSSIRTHLKIDLGSLLGVPVNMLKFVEFMQLKYPDMNPYRLNANQIMKDIIMKNAKTYYMQKYLYEDAASKKENIKKVLEIIKMHIPLAIQVCSGDGREPIEPIHLATELSVKEQQDMLNFGIVSKNDEGKFYFIHASYSAHILAQHFCLSKPDAPLLSDFFLNSVLCKNSCDLVRQFYEEILMTGVNDTISSEWMSVIRNFLVKTYHLSNSDFEHDKIQSTTSVLDLAIIDQRLSLAKLILRSFAPDHTIECRRLIKRKLKVEMNDVRQRVKNNRVINPDTFTKSNNSAVNGKRRKICCAKNWDATPLQFVDLSPLSLAIMFGDRELVHTMYLILGKEDGKELDVKKSTDYDCFHFYPLHLAVIGCNPATYDYLSFFRKISPNNRDSRGYLPMHMIFFNRWVLKFPSMDVNKLNSEPEILREVHIRKYYDDQLDPEWNDRVGQVPDRGGHLPLLSSCFIMGYTKIQMKKNENFHVKRDNQPWKICYFKSYTRYIYFAESLSGRTLSNFRGEVESGVPAPFHLACAAGYLPVIKVMIERGVRLNIKDKYDRTALYVSLCKEHLHVVQYLLEIGINRDVTRTVNGIPLLHHLSLQNLQGAIGLLVKEFKVPVDLPSVSLDSCTPLHMACIGGSSTAAHKLIKLGANINAEDEEGYTPLLHAIHPTSKSDLVLVNLLINNGADVNAHRDGGKTCLHEAVRMGNIPLVHCLLPHANVNAVTDAGQTPLHLACKYNCTLEMFELLIKAGAKIDVWDNKRETPLFVLCKKNCAEINKALYLLEQGASVDHFSKSKHNLMEVLRKRNPELGALIFKAWKPPRPSNEQ